MKHKILVLGTFHMAGSEDLHGEKQQEVLNQQAQLAQIRSWLAAFRPTKIAVEWEKSCQEALDQQYGDYLAGSFQLTDNEIHQIAFPLARQLGLPRLHAVDWMERGVGLRGYGDVYEYMQQQEPDLLAQLQEWESALFTKGLSLPEAFRALNSHESEQATKAYYVNHARIGIQDDYYGLGWLMWWYQRNLIQFANLSQLVTPGQEERILFLVGAAHKGIISDFLRDSQLFEVVETMDYLCKDDKNVRIS